MKHRIFLLIFLTSYWRYAQGSNNAAIVSEVPVAVGYRGPCDPNPCGPGNICKVQGGAGLCKPDMNAFFGGKNVSSRLPDAPPSEEAPETEAAPVVPVTDAPMKAVATEVEAPVVVPIAGEQYTVVTDAPNRPITAAPETPLVVQLGPIAEFPQFPAEAPVVAIAATTRAPFPHLLQGPYAERRPLTPRPTVAPVVTIEASVVAPIVAMPITNAPIAPIAFSEAGGVPTRSPPIAENVSTPAPPIAEIRTNQVTDAPIVPIAMTPDAIVAPPPIAEHPEALTAPPFPSGCRKPAAWGYKNSPCDPNPCGPNTKCNVAPNGLARCRCMEEYVPEANTIIGCKLMCVSNEECPGDFFCKANKCARVCGPGACGLKADCDGYQHRAICNCPEGYTGDPDVQCDRAAMNIEHSGAAIGQFVVLDIDNKLRESDEPVQVVYMDTGEPVKPEEAADALESLAIAKEAVAAEEAAAEAQKLVDEKNNAMQGTLSVGALLISLLLIVQI